MRAKFNKINVRPEQWISKGPKLLSLSPPGGEVAQRLGSPNFRCGMPPLSYHSSTQGSQQQPATAAVISGQTTPVTTMQTATLVAQSWKPTFASLFSNPTTSKKFPILKIYNPFINTPYNDSVQYGRETYTFTVGYLELSGSRVPLKKPLLVLKKTTLSDADQNSDCNINPSTLQLLS
ncbi:hypothetical protein LguiB_032400 [Lonicera macranthoides]